MATYTVLASESSIQVISPTLVLDTITTTVQTSPSGVIASVWLAKADFDAGTAPALLTSFADNIEQVMATGKVSAGTSGQSIDASGLMQQTVDFTVSYTPPGSKTGPLTVQVEVPSGDFTGTTEFGANYPLEDALTLIDDAYTNLVNMAKG